MSPFNQQAVKKNTVGYKSRKFIFSKDNRVMQLENRTECANGDIGIVLEANETGVIVDFFGTQVHYETAEELETLALAYSMTIHKSQGSEYKAVIMCLLDSHEKMLNRNLIYTGVTRAKKECFLYYQPKALEKAIKTKADENRYSFLVEKLRALDIEYRLAQYNIA
jgi:exodeoxyribonuclease V alpha subunit